MTDLTIRFIAEDDDGIETEYSLPARREVCPRCKGNGTHVNPNIDGNGITASEWAEWDDDDKDDYMSGKYDVVCTECEGANVVDIIDYERAEAECPEALKLYEAQQRSDHASDTESRYWDRYTRQWEGE